jgi:CoA transferase family III
MGNTSEDTLQDGNPVDRSGYGVRDVIRDVWTSVGLPEAALNSLVLPGEEDTGPIVPSSFKLGTLSHACLALAALSASQVHALRNGLRRVPNITVTRRHTTVEFKSERLYRLAGVNKPLQYQLLGGLHRTNDGFVRIHDSFPNHVKAILGVLGLPGNASREDIAAKTKNWASIDLETTATVEGSAAAYALRSFQQWDSLPQSKAISNLPIGLKQLALGPAGFPPRMTPGQTRPLKGLRVVEMSRVIAAPLSGKTLAAYGADVLWVTSPNLPDLPALDREFSRGKRTIQLDIRDPAGKETLLELLRTCDVFIQGYRPGSLAAHGLSPEKLVEANPGIIIANLSAFGPRGPWSGRRGFDSLVQTCSGMNVSEAEHAGQGEPARVLPSQALDHGAGYMLATGIMAAVHRRAVEGGAWQVDVSLAGVMKYLRSLGQYPGTEGFQCDDFNRPEDVPEEYFETNETGYGTMTTVRHAASIDGCDVGWEIMPKPLGSDEAKWLAP